MASVGTHHYKSRKEVGNRRHSGGVWRRSSLCVRYDENVKRAIVYIPFFEQQFPVEQTYDPSPQVPSGDTTPVGAGVMDDMVVAVVTGGTLVVSPSSAPPHVPNSAWHPEPQWKEDAPQKPGVRKSKDNV